MNGDRQGGRRGDWRKVVGLSLRCLRPILLERLAPSSGVGRRQVTRRCLSGERAPVLGCSATVTKSQRWASDAAGVCFLTVQEAGRSRSRSGQKGFLVRFSSLFAAGGACSSCFHAICPLFTHIPGVCVLTSSSYEVTSQIRLGLHFHLITLLKALSLNTITF